MRRPTAARLGAMLALARWREEWVRRRLARPAPTYHSHHACWASATNQCGVAVLPTRELDLCMWLIRSTRPPYPHAHPQCAAHSTHRALLGTQAQLAVEHGDFVMPSVAVVGSLQRESPLSQQQMCPTPRYITHSIDRSSVPTIPRVQSPMPMIPPY